MATSETTIKFWNTNVGKTIKALVYVLLSSAISYFITATQNNPLLFGTVTVLINGILVNIYTTFFDRKTPNIGAM